jgi:hypothetical protein
LHGVPDPTDGHRAELSCRPPSRSSGHTGIDNDPADPAIQTAKPGVGGFFTLYEHPTPPAGLTGACDPEPCPGADGAEYLPLLTFLMADFRLFSLTASAEVDPFPESFGFCIVWPVCVDLEITPASEGDIVFDVWSNVDTNYTIYIDLGVGDLGFRNLPDYTENDPIHIMPGLDDLTNAKITHEYDAVIGFDGFHDFGDHVDPFGP